jgi:hypothetical protein|tara:strand:- start:164 stop:763 length:600 start_codon:yes stop_codon:yes gene_type:complete
MKKLLIVLFIFSFSQLSFANERFIPLELFTGGEIRDDIDIKFTPADKVFGKKKRKKIVGPLDWRAPGSEEIIKVYKRTKKNREGRVRKTQYFTITNDGQCMGRVYDQRRSGTKYIKNGCKFPLGFWKKNETRTFSVTDGGRSRTVELKILQLGKKPTDCVKFNWKLFDAATGQKYGDNDYKFCKGRAMTDLKIRKIKTN